MPEQSPPSHDELVDFYDESYSHEGVEAQIYARWRALGARGKADHVIELCSRASIAPASTLEVGCGDGALLAELAERDFGGTLHGVEITQAAVKIAGERAEIESVELYDGQRLRSADGAYELGIVSHVLEHVTDPPGLLAEIARTCEVVVMEVPLEENLSARRTAKREHADEVGHLQRLSLGSARTIAARAGLRVEAELEDALPLNVHRFFAGSLAMEATAVGKWAVRRVLHGLAPALARRLFTVHYACLCVPEALPPAQEPRSSARFQKLAAQPNKQ